MAVVRGRGGGGGGGRGGGGGAVGGLVGGGAGDAEVPDAVGARAGGLSWLPELVP